MRDLLDLIINKIKWPIAVYMTISVPALLNSLDYFRFASQKFLFFGGGIIFFVFAKMMSDSTVRTSMQTVAHELTHAFFALLTLHKVKEIHLDKDKGGDMVFEGEGNWLIVVAPYFFPLFCFGFMVISSIWTMFFPSNIFLNLFLGYFMGYHIDTVVSQIHDKQTDLPKVSYTFCWLFLPGANFFVLGGILAFNSRGWGGIGDYISLINHLNMKNFYDLWNLLF